MIMRMTFHLSLKTWDSQKWIIMPELEQCGFNIRAATWQNQQSDCAPSEDADQPGHLPSLIRVLAVRLMGSWGPKLSSCRQRRLWSDWADAQLIWVFAGHTLILLVFPCHGSYSSVPERCRQMGGQGWKILKTVTCPTSPIVSNTMENLIINTGKIQNFHSSCSMRNLSWRADEWIFPAPTV